MVNLPVVYRPALVLPSQRIDGLPVAGDGTGAPILAKPIRVYVIFLEVTGGSPAATVIDNPKAVDESLERLCR